MQCAFIIGGEVTNESSDVVCGSLIVFEAADIFQLVLLGVLDAVNIFFGENALVQSIIFTETQEVRILANQEIEARVTGPATGSQHMYFGRDKSGITLLGQSIQRLGENLRGHATDDEQDTTIVATRFEISHYASFQYGECCCRPVFRAFGGWKHAFMVRRTRPITGRHHTRWRR